MTEPEAEARRNSRHARLDDNLVKTQAALARELANHERLQTLLETPFSEEHRERYEKAISESERVTRAIRRGIEEIEYEIASGRGRPIAHPHRS